jgi:hypothetical protein
MNINELKKLADESGVSVLVSINSGTAKAVMTEHLNSVDADDDDEGVWYTDDHIGYMKIPRVSLKHRMDKEVAS